MSKFWQIAHAVVSDRTAWILVSVAVFFFTLAGPFGTFDSLDIAHRFIYWAPICLFGFVCAVLSKCLASTVWHAAKPFQNRVLTLVAFVVLFAPVLFKYNGFWHPHDDTSLMGFAKIVAFVAIMVCGALIVCAHWTTLTRTDGAQNDDVTVPRLHERLNLSQICEIVRLTVDDHYVEVILADGRKDRVLMRFADAVQEMEQADGFMVHRSHWVNRRVIVDMQKQGSREYLNLSCGSQIPVSRTYRDNVIAAGFAPAA